MNQSDMARLEAAFSRMADNMGRVADALVLLAQATAGEFDEAAQPPEPPPPGQGIGMGG